MKPILCLALAASLASCASPTPPASLSDAPPDPAEQSFDAAMITIRGGEQPSVETWGVADAATRFPVYSLAKPMTAAAAARLMERGALDPAADLRSFLPDFPERETPVRVIHLAQHSSGIRHYRADEASEECASLDAALARFRDDPLVATPGSETHYSSHGYVALSAVIANAAGTSFDDAMADLVFTPMEIAPERVVAPHQNAPGLTCKFGAGGFLASAVEVASFAQGLFSPDFLSPRSQQLFLRGSDTYTAAGKGDGGNAFLWVRPSTGDALVLVSNAGTAEQQAIARAHFEAAKAGFSPTVE